MGDKYVAPNPSNNLTIPKGVLTIGLWSGSTPPTTFTDVGNCTAMTLEPTRETLPHYSSRSGTRNKDRVAEIEAGYNVNFTLDELAMFNLKMFLRANHSGNYLYANENLGQQYALIFTSDNSYGRNYIITIHKAEIAPDGGISVIGDEYASMSFSGEGLSDIENHPTSRFFTWEYTDNGATGDSSTTTSSTSTTTTEP